MQAGHALLLLLVAGFAAVGDGITYPGGIVEPCLDPTANLCFPTRCIHLYTVPQQYVCQQSTFPRYDYLPAGPQCGRVECACAPGYHGGSCLPAVIDNCLQHSCTRANATSYSPTRVQPEQDLALQILGIGLNAAPGTDRAKVVLGSCTGNATLARGTNETSDLWGSDTADTSAVLYLAYFTDPGEYTLCYKEQYWTFHAVAPPLVVAGAVSWTAPEGLFARLNQNVTLRLTGFGFTAADDLKFISPQDIIAYDATNPKLNSTCLYANPKYQTVPVVSSHLAATAALNFKEAYNFTVCHRAQGGQWRDLGPLTVGDVPLWYTVAPSSLTAGGLVLNQPFNISFGGATQGYALLVDTAEIHAGKRYYNEETGAITWTGGVCGDGTAERSTAALQGSRAAALSATAYWPLTLTDTFNSSALCYWSAQYQRWLVVNPLNPWDSVVTRRYWYHGFEAPQPSCLAGWQTVTGPTPGCSADVNRTLHQRQNASMQVFPGAVLSYSLPIAPIRPDKFSFWVKPTCNNRPLFRMRLLDYLNQELVSFHFGCPYITLNHLPSSTKWSADTPDRFAVGWHKVMVQLFWDLKQLYFYFDDQRIVVGTHMLHDMANANVQAVSRIVIESDRDGCPVLLDEMQFFKCWVTQVSLKFQQTTQQTSDIPPRLLKALGLFQQQSGFSPVSSEEITGTACLAENFWDEE